MRVTTRVNKAAAGGLAAEERLLAALAEHVKLPLMQIARRSELARLSGDYEKHLEIIELTADTALQLLDSYLLSLHLTHRDAVELQPVSIGATLDSVAHALDRIAKDTGTELEIRMSGRFEPVLAHPGALESALVSLGCVLIEAQHTLAAETATPKLMLAAHRSKNGIVTGLYAGIDTLSQEMLRRGHSLYGRARLAMPELSVDSGAGVFVADSLLSAMASQLRVSHYHSLSGLAATLASTKQLELVVN